MLRSNHFVRVFIKVCAIYKTYECFFTKFATLEENMKLFFEGIENDILNTYDLDQYLVYDHASNLLCDKDMTLDQLNFYDGILLLVF